MRAHFTRPVTDDQGDLLPNVQVTVYEPGTTTLISQTLYSTDTGNNVLSNPFVSSTGVIDIYLDTPARVRFGLIQGNLPVQYYEDVDVLAAGSDSQHTGTGPVSLMIGVGASANGDSSTALGTSASSAGTNSVALGASANALGEYGSALGTAATVQNDSGTAVGRNASVTGDRGLAAGNGAQASGDSSTALGDASEAAWTRSTAVGAGAVADGENQVMLGASGDTVAIPEGAVLRLTAPDGTSWNVTVANDGSLTTTQV